MLGKSNERDSKLLKLVCIFLLLISFSCGKNNQDSKNSQVPAKVENAVKENQLATVTLSVQAEQRLGIKIKTVKSQNLSAYFKLGGEIIALPGNELNVTAPVAGTVLNPKGNKTPLAGDLVNKGQEILRFLILPIGKDFLGARNDVQVNKEKLHVAQEKAIRAKKLLNIKAISEKKYQESQLELTTAKAEWEAAVARLNLLTGNDLDLASAGLPSLVMESPINGVLQKIFVASGQTVPVTTPLFEVAKVNPLWIRVPVYIGDLAKIDRQKDAVIETLGTKDNSLILKARPVEGPPLSDANSASADLYFEITNKKKNLRIGQKVNVTLIGKSSAESLVVPRSAIIYDIYGGNWVYIKIAPQTYVRQRVLVGHILGELAVLTRGINKGDQVVIEGAAEIFGTEFGVGK